VKYDDEPGDTGWASVWMIFVSTDIASISPASSINPAAAFEKSGIDAGEMMFKIEELITAGWLKFVVLPIHFH
jgi:hypothetical protein